MSVLSVQNLQETFVGANISRTGSAQVTDPNAAGYIVNGEVVVVTGNGVVYDSTAQAWGPTLTSSTTPYIQIVQRVGDQLIWSNRIFGARVTAYRGKAGATGQEQIYHIGYDGVTATKALDITAGLDFQLTVIENQDDMMWSEQKKKNVVNVPNNLVTSQQALASAIVKNQMKKYLTDGSAITACMLNSGAGVASDSGNARTVAVTHGSNVITYSGTTDRVTAGSVIRLGATGSGRGILVPTYTVLSAHPTISNGFILDMPYAGPSNSALADGDHGAITTVGANWGVRFTGKALPYRRDFFKFKRVGFTLQMSGFGATPLTKTLEAAYGSGDGRLVLEEESFSKGFQGALNRMTVPLPLHNETFIADATTANTINTTYGDAFTNATAYYDCITIEHFGQDQQTVVATPMMPQIVKIYMYDVAAGGSGAGQGKTGNTSIQVALNDYFASTPTVFANLSVFA